MKKEGSRRHGGIKKHILTYAGLKQYEDELKSVEGCKKRKVMKIKGPRTEGIIENAEYVVNKRMSREILSCS